MHVIWVPWVVSIKVNLSSNHMDSCWWEIRMTWRFENWTNIVYILTLLVTPKHVRWLGFWSMRPTHTHGREWSLFSHVVSVRPTVRQYVPTFKNLAKQNFQVRKKWSLWAGLWVWPSGSLMPRMSRRFLTFDNGCHAHDALLLLFVKLFQLAGFKGFGVDLGYGLGDHDDVVVQERSELPVVLTHGVASGGLKWHYRIVEDLDRIWFYSHFFSSWLCITAGPPELNTTLVSFWEKDEWERKMEIELQELFCKHQTSSPDDVWIFLRMR